MDYDVIVIGGGHAGCEAAAAAARIGATVALVTHSATTIGAMSCNPAIGGVGKGHLVREVDACDGLIARAADHAAIHYRMLNASKGKAVQGPRVQADRRRYKAAVDALIAEAGILIIEGEAVALTRKGGRISGLRLTDGGELACRALVIASGTFLNARLHFGLDQREGGRAGDPAATKLAAQLREIAPVARLKTGTPPRLDGRTIDWARLEAQPGDAADWTMSAMGAGRVAPQVACAITRTNRATHDRIRDAFDRSPLFSGAIEAQGPRYCPSIEDKVVRFGDRDGHQIFLEPEGLETPLVYPNGISTSLPIDAQRSFVRTIAGLEQAEIAQPGYAVEYDHLDPRALSHSLEMRGAPGLFLAGQVNGTTGYEEAAAQGLVAGINAAAVALCRPSTDFARSEAYIGVLIDDLVTQGVTEPYRMLTARAEYRLHLRPDNAEARLNSLALAAGCLSPARQRVAALRENERDRVRRALEDGAAVPDVQRSVLDEVEEDIRYAPYIERQRREAAALEADNSAISPALSYRAVPGLSNEMIEKLEATRPATLAAAARIRGITPAALSAILVHGAKKAA